MKYTTLLIVVLIVFTGCSINGVCDNRFDFVSTMDTIPTLNFNTKKHYDLIRQDISNLYNEDLCKRCSLVEFKIPFAIENKNGFLKILTDFDTPYCEKCPLMMGLRHYYYIGMNAKNQLFVEDNIRNIDSLQLDIENQLERIGKNDMEPNFFSEVNFRIHWEEGTNQAFLDSVLTKIYKAHLNVVERKVKMLEKDFCLFNKKELIKLKNEYPLRIEFDLGKFEKMIENVDRNFKIKVKDNSL